MSALKFERLLFDWAESTVPSWPIGRKVAVMRRLGWIGDRNLTLNEIGTQLGITRQSAHETVQRFVGSLTAPGEELRRLLRHADTRVLGLNLPIRIERADRFLAEQLAGEFVPVRNALSVAPFAGVRMRMAMDGNYVVHEGQSAPDAALFKRLIGKKIRRDGYLNSTELAAATAVPAALAWEDAKLEIQDLDDVELTEADFFVSAGGRRSSRLVSNVNKMLAVSSPMHLSKVAGGLARQTRAGRLPGVPSDEVLAVMLRSLGFLVVDHVVEARSHSDPVEVLSPIEMFLLEVLGQQDHDLTQLAALAFEADIERRTLSHFLSYSPIIESRGNRRWGLRGRSPLTRARPSSASVSYSWNESGNLVLNVLVSSLGGLVVDVPSSVQAILNNRAFEIPNIGGIFVRDGRFLVKPELYDDRWMGDWLPLSFNIAAGLLEIG